MRRGRRAGWVQWTSVAEEPPFLGGSWRFLVWPFRALTLTPRARALQFWKVWGELDVKLPEYSNFWLFKEGIKPTADDPANVNGGRILIRTKKHDTSRLWFELILIVITQQVAPPPRPAFSMPCPALPAEVFTARSRDTGPFILLLLLLLLLLFFFAAFPSSSSSSSLSFFACLRPFRHRPLQQQNKTGSLSPQLSPMEAINGIVLSIRPRENVVAVWVRSEFEPDRPVRAQPNR